MTKEDETVAEVGEESKGGDGEEMERAGWGNQLEFFFSCVGYAVGLGNIWRFPYLCFQYGGGAFLIPYIIMLVICGLPLFFLELAFGQFASLGPITIWKSICPLFSGLGIAMVVISGMVSLYYQVIVMWGMFYALVSLISLDGELPWAQCGQPWNTKYCTSSKPNLTGLPELEVINKTLDKMDMDCVNETMAAENLTYPANLTLNTLNNLTHCDKTVLPSEEYFKYYVLQLDSAENFGNLGGMSITLTVLLALSWLILFYSLRKGVESSGKIVYFMATFPYFVLVALLIRGITLPGYMDGIEFYIIPKWEKLLNVNVWRQAATQIFFSLGPAFGSLVNMASYNPFKHNCYRDAIVVAFINCGTSIFAGFVIFSMLGYMAFVTNQDVESVTQSGPGLVFVVYPEGIARMDGAPIWAFLFFFMLISLGLDSQFAMFEVVISSIVDEFPGYLRPRRVKFTFVCHLLGFLLGLPMVTYGGIWVLELMNNYSASYALMFACLCELVAINYMYGNNRFCGDVEMMLGFRPNWYWRSMWMFITPVAILVMLIASGIQYEAVGYDDYMFEDYVQGIGFVMVGVPIAIIVVGALYQLCKFQCSSDVWKPIDSWGPSKKEHRTGRYAMDNAGFVGDELTEVNGVNGINEVSEFKTSY